MPHRLNLRAPNDCQKCGWRPKHMFCNLAPAALADFDSLGASITLPKGAYLFREGDAGDRVHILCDGTVKLSCDSKDGKTLNLKIALAGDVLGLNAVILNEQFEVTGEALESVSLKRISRAEFIPFLERHGEASIHAAKALAQEYKSAYTEARMLALSSSVTARLGGLLLDWGRSASCSNAGMSFNMVLTHADLASFTGTSRESITRALGKMQRDKMIAIHGALIQILLPEKLAELAAWRL